jgi:protease I
MGEQHMAKVLFVIAPEDFRDEELFMTQEEVAKCGHEMWIASHKTGTCMGVHGGIAQSDLLVEDVDTNSFDGVVFVGGKGSSVFFDDPHAWMLAQAMNGQGKMVAAICIAPVILANAGLLKKKNATVFKSEIAAIEAKGAVYSGSGVTVDGNLITASGPDQAKQFGQEICGFLSK